MTKLTPSDITKFAQKAAILERQVDELEKLLDSYEQKRLRPDDKVVAESYNRILDNCRKLFALDSAFVDAISPLKEVVIFPNGGAYFSRRREEVKKVLPQLKMLKGTLDVFFEWLKLLKEKKDT